MAFTTGFSQTAPDVASVNIDQAFGLPAVGNLALIHVATATVGNVDSIYLRVVNVTNVIYHVSIMTGINAAGRLQIGYFTIPSGASPVTLWSGLPLAQSWAMFVQTDAPDSSTLFGYGYIVRALNN
jgi:hypothetical protein